MTRPKPLGHPRYHLLMLRAMAKAVGINLAEAQYEGALSQEDWAAAVTKCRSCHMVEECELYIAACADDPRAAPKACMNARLLARLSATPATP